MRESRKSLKLKARRAMTGKYLMASGVFAVWMVIDLTFFIMWQICMLFSRILAASMGDVGRGFFVILAVMGTGMLAFILFEFLLVPGIIRMYLNICQGRQARVWDMFWGFHNHGWKFFGVNLLILLISVVLVTPQVILTAASHISGDWRFAQVYLAGYGLLLLTAGVWAGLTYGQFYIILADDPEKPVIQALEESRKIMKGNRCRLLVLSLSFAGWIPIVYITLGAALIWLGPYVICTMLFFYLNVKEDRYQE